MAYLTKSFCAVVFLVLACHSAPPVLAQRAMPGTGGSLPLADVMNAAAKYPNLVQQIRLQLLSAGPKREQVICSAERFSNEWSHLGGARVGPYECAVGKRMLRVTTVATFYDRNGHRLKGDDPGLRTKATRVVESGFKWTWK